MIYTNKGSKKDVSTLLILRMKKYFNWFNPEYIFLKDIFVGI